MTDADHWLALNARARIWLSRCAAPISHALASHVRRAHQPFASDPAVRAASTSLTQLVATTAMEAVDMMPVAVAMEACRWGSAL